EKSAYHTASSGPSARRRGRDAGFGKTYSLIFPDRQGARIDGADLVGAEVDENRNALGVDHEAIRPRIRRGRGDELDLAARGIEPAHHVAILYGEPDDSLGVDCKRVRVLRLRIGHSVFGDVAALGVELADEAQVVAGETDVAVLVFD